MEFMADSFAGLADSLVFGARYTYSWPKYFWAIAFGMLAGGFASIAALIVSKKPDLADKIESLTEYFGYVGGFMLLAGVWGLIDGFVVSKFYTKYAGGLMKMAPIMAIAVFLYPPVCLVLGLLQGLPLIGQWTGKDMSKIEEQTKKLAVVQVPVGITAIVVGIIWIMMMIGIGPF